MSDDTRQILMPGETAQAAAQAAAPAAAAPLVERKKPGPKPRAAQAAAPAGDDLDQFDDDELPPRPAAPAPAANSLAGLSPEMRQEVNRLIAEGVRAAMSSRDPATAIKIAAQAAQPQRLPTQDEARVMCDDMVAKNIRPRAILTTDGWYAHPEMARVRDHGVAKLQVD